jgi:hypothetical protein
MMPESELRWKRRPIAETWQHSQSLASTHLGQLREQEQLLLILWVQPLGQKNHDIYRNKGQAQEQFLVLGR